MSRADGQCAILTVQRRSRNGRLNRKSNLRRPVSLATARAPASALRKRVLERNTVSQPAHHPSIVPSCPDTLKRQNRALLAFPINPPSPVPWMYYAVLYSRGAQDRTRIGLVQPVQSVMPSHDRLVWHTAAPNGVQGIWQPTHRGPGNALIPAFTLKQREACWRRTPRHQYRRIGHPTALLLPCRFKEIYVAYASACRKQFMAEIRFIGPMRTRR